MTDRPKRYALVSVEGELSFHVGNWRQMRAVVAEEFGCAGETGTETPNPYGPITAMDFTRDSGIGDDPRRMNKVANGMFWELSNPSRFEKPVGDEADDLPEDSGRVLKMRGPVVFYHWDGDLEDDEAEQVQQAHAAVFGRLRQRGWI